MIPEDSQTKIWGVLLQVKELWLLWRETPTINTKIIQKGRVGVAGNLVTTHEIVVKFLILNQQILVRLLIMQMVGKVQMKMGCGLAERKMLKLKILNNKITWWGVRILNLKYPHQMTEQLNKRLNLHV